MKRFYTNLDTLSNLIDAVRVEDERKEKLKKLIALSKDKSDKEKEIIRKQMISLVEERLQLEKSFKYNAELIYFIYNYIESLITESRWFNKEYDNELEPISQKMRDVEKKFGLEDGYSWLRGKGPKEYILLEEEYENILNKKQEESLQECLSQKTIDYITKYKKDYDSYLKIRSKIQKKIKNQKKQPQNDKLTTIIKTYETESKICAKNGAYHAAFIMIGAATEALILDAVIKKSTEVAPIIKILKEGKILQHDKIERFGLDDLINIANKMNWLVQYKYGNNIIDISQWVHDVRRIRNYAHPGKLLRAKEITEISKGDYRIALAVYELLKHNIKFIKKK